MLAARGSHEGQADEQRARGEQHHLQVTPLPPAVPSKNCQNLATVVLKP